MARKIKTKDLVNTRLAANYGGWTYCTECGENIGYLCYATYDKVEFQYECNCGSHGSILIDFEDSVPGSPCDEELITVKNRLCCPKMRRETFVPKGWDLVAQIKQIAGSIKEKA